MILVALGQRINHWSRNERSVGHAGISMPRRKAPICASRASVP